MALNHPIELDDYDYGHRRRGVGLLPESAEDKRALLSITGGVIAMAVVGGIAFDKSRRAA